MVLRDSTVSAYSGIVSLRRMLALDLLMIIIIIIIIILVLLLLVTLRKIAVLLRKSYFLDPGVICGGHSAPVMAGFRVLVHRSQS